MLGLILRILNYILSRTFFHFTDQHSAAGRIVVRKILLFRCFSYFCSSQLPRLPQAPSGVLKERGRKDLD